MYVYADLKSSGPFDHTQWKLVSMCVSVKTRPHNLPSHGDITLILHVVCLSWLWLITRRFNIACNDFHKKKDLYYHSCPWTLDIFSQFICLAVCGRENFETISHGGCLLAHWPYWNTGIYTHVTLLTTAGHLILCEWVCIEMEKGEQGISCIVILLI